MATNRETLLKKAAEAEIGAITGELYKDAKSAAFSPISKTIDYASHIETNYNKMKEGAKQLCAMTDYLQAQINSNLEKEATKVCQLWMERVQKIQEDVKALESEYFKDNSFLAWSDISKRMAEKYDEMHCCKLDMSNMEVFIEKPPSPVIEMIAPNILYKPSLFEFSGHMEYCLTEYGEASRYRIEETISEGNYGVVYSAFDTHAKEKVAIKKICNIFEHVSDAIRVLREIKLLRILRHPDIVQIKNILLSSSRREFNDIYVVFELMESNLHEVIKANDDLQPEHYQFFLYQLLRALKYLHTANVFHRDLKPENILANANGKLKICDFGLARVAFNDAPSLVFGTDYVATRWCRPPELCGSFFSQYTRAIDIWSIGCIFAEILTREPLFPGLDIVHQLDLITDLLGTPSPEAIAKLRNGKAKSFLTNMKKKNPVPFTQKFHNIDPLALRLLERMLAFDPEDRPSAEEALADPYFKGLAKLEREPSAQPITKKEFEFERRRINKNDVRELIFQEVLEYHPTSKLLVGNLGSSKPTGSMYPSALDDFKKQFASLEKHFPSKRRHASLPRASVSYSDHIVKDIMEVGNDLLEHPVKETEKPHVDRISRTPIKEVFLQSSSNYQGEGQRFVKFRPHTLENMSSKTTSRIKLARCPRCKQILPEMPNVPVYQCGECGTLIQGQVSEDKETGSSSQVKIHSAGEYSQNKNDEKDQIESSDCYGDKLALVNLLNQDEDSACDQSGYMDLESQQLEEVKVSSDDQMSGCDKYDSDVCDSEQLMGDGNSSNLIKFNYGLFMDDKTKKCARHCALFCEDLKIARESLMNSWISEGLIGSYQESNEVLQTLINDGLLKSTEDGKFVELQETNRLLLLEHIFPPIEGRLFLLRGSMRLTELPKDVEWEMFREISLMDNELSELTENLICPKVQALFLQRNFKLRVIHDSFFHEMPNLEVLNLSRTRIKSLPKSLFALVKLRRLFLNHCDLLLTLPPEVGELKCLEVLDLEGTTIIDLPENVKQLVYLRCLEVSFCEPMRWKRSAQLGTIIPGGVISALSRLEELNIDVSPEDKRWNASVEDIIFEVCRLTKLDTIKFYLPRVELLRHFQWESIPMAHPPLSHFSFTVGDHAKRIISRLPHDVESELEQYDKCLKYVNGEGVPEEIRNTLRQASAFFLDRHKTVKKLSEFGIDNMMKLECCVIGECEDLQAIFDGDQLAEEASGDSTTIGLESLEYMYIYYVNNLSSIWEGRPLYNSNFLSLKSLTLYMCPEMNTIFTPGLLANLSSLEELALDDCPKITRLISFNDSETEIKHDLPALKKISLHFLPELETISDVLHILPSVEWMSFYHCPNLKSLPINKAFHKNLRKIKGELHWWEETKPKDNGQDFWNDIFTPVK